MNDMSQDLGRETNVLTFGSLVSRRILIPSERTNLVAVDKYFLVSLLKNQVERIYFDENWYFTKYPDVREACEAGQVASAKHHYVTDGYYEHRMPYEITVDKAWYLEKYPDVRAAVDNRHFESAQIHFETAGYREGREPFANFMLLSDYASFN